MRRPAELLRVIDGDTYHLRVDLGFYVSTAIKVRLRGYSCPELREAGGPEAAAAARARLEQAVGIEVESYKDVRSFERWVCDVFVDGASLGSLLFMMGHAVESVA